jgi:hypothetical protein
MADDAVDTASGGTSETPRLRANRANAKRSTGPRSAVGKKRSARNALRHGLARPIHEMAELAPEITQLSRQLAGVEPDASINETAEQVAEAQLDLARIRRARHRLILAIEKILASGEGPKMPDGRSKAAEDAIEQAMRRLAPGLERYFVRNRTTGDSALALQIKELAALECYERRAFSRRKRALRQLSEQMLADGFADT